MAYRGIYTYAWDLADEGFEAVTTRFATAAPTRLLSPAPTTPASSSARTGAPARSTSRRTARSISARDRIVTDAVKPLPNDLLRDIDPFAELVRVAPDLDRVAWTVCCHNTRLGELHPELVARNCFGDPLIYSLNPADPEVRAYVVALCRDLAEQHELTALALETPAGCPMTTATTTSSRCCR